MEKIKIIFTDIDGTLLDNSKGYYFISPNNIQLLKKFQLKEIYVVLTTGRSRDDTLPIWNKIHLNKYANFIIYNDGEYIEDLGRNELIKILDLEPFTSKGMAARILIERLRLNKKEAFAIGNDINDYSLFREIPNSLAVNGSVPSLREIAKYKTKLSYSKSLETLIK